MKHTRHLISLAFASLALVCAADVTRDTEWQDVPPSTRVGTVVDLGQGGGADTNEVNALIRSYDETNLTARINNARPQDYTTTNAVRAIVTGYGYETHAAAATAYLAATNYADAVGANISTNLIGATNTLAAVAHSGDYGDLTGGPEALPNPYPLRFMDFGEKSGGGYYYGDSQIVLYAGANLAFSGTTGGIVLNATVPTISPTDTTFSNATVAVVNDMSNRSVTAAVDAAMTDILGDNWKTTYGGGLAGLIAALVAALTWLKNHRAGSFTATGITTPATTTNGTADLSTLFSSANTSLTSTIGSTIEARCQSLDPANSSISDVIKALKGIN